MANRKSCQRIYLSERALSGSRRAADLSAAHVMALVGIYGRTGGTIYRLYNPRCYVRTLTSFNSVVGQNVPRRCVNWPRILSRPRCSLSVQALVAFVCPRTLKCPKGSFCSNMPKPPLPMHRWGGKKNPPHSPQVQLLR